MTDILAVYRIVDSRIQKGDPVPESVLLPETYDGPEGWTYIDSVLDDFMDGFGSRIDNWAIRNMFLSYGVSPTVADRAMRRLATPHKE